MTDNLVDIPDGVVLNKIRQIRGEKVMLDKDLAELYGVKAIRLREQVKRNLNRFPERFMFQLTDAEVEDMVSQNAIPSRQVLGGSLPYAFSEFGVLQLSNVLKSERAAQVSIRIIEMFVLLREAMFIYKDTAVLYEKNERRFEKQDQKIELLFTYLDKFIDKNEKPREKIGFKVKDDKNKI